MGDKDMGELRENNIINWSRFKSNTKGNMLEKAKQGYIKFCKMLHETDFELNDDYLGSKKRVEIKYKYNNIVINTDVDTFTRTYSTIINFKNDLKENGDGFIKFIGLTNKGVLIAKIKTFDGGVVNIDIASYNHWNESRKDLYDKLKEVNGSIKEPYIDNKRKMIFYIENIKLSPKSANSFKRQTYKTITEFKKQLKINSDIFNCFTKINKSNDLIAKVKLQRGTYKEIALNTYTRWCKARELTYNYCYKKGYKILSEYTGSKDKILIDFNCGHEPHWIIPNSLQKGHGCPFCKSDNNSKENHHNWKGGITPLSVYLRQVIKLSDWQKSSFAKYNGQCIITGIKNTNIHLHHLYGFNKILLETVESLNLDFRDSIKLYSDEELKLLEDKCLELHYKYGLGVPLTEEMHEKFHKTYGKGNNTPEQFEEFKKTESRLFGKNIA